jgi:hypothetical protein
VDSYVIENIKDDEFFFDYFQNGIFSTHDGFYDFSKVCNRRNSKCGVLSFRRTLLR